MSQRGRPPITREIFEGRVRDYCAKYGVTPKKDGLPPFPTGRRETWQHREWISLVQAGIRLRRRTAGLCRQCDRPAAPGKVLCDQHQPSLANLAPADSKATCLVCGQAVDGTAVTEHLRDAQASRVLVHSGCKEVISLAQKLGPDLLDRIRQYLWPGAQYRSRGRPSVETVIT